jgi:lysophospholipid acyltransferase (LPLAT)-like uncharacterized protein
MVPEGTPYVKAKLPQRYMFCMWHDHIVMAVFSSRTYSLAGLISQHRDGGYLADSVQIAGIHPVRGSTSRGGMEAVREILSRPDLHLAMTPDGPRGPRRKMKDGIVYMSSRSGRPIIPTALLANRYWRIPGSWTDMTIPKPFSRVLLITGTPIVVPEDLPREDMDRWAAALELEMERLDQIALRIINGEDHAATEIANPDFASRLLAPTQPSTRAAA